MNVKETLEALAEQLQTTGVRTIFGDPVSAEGRTIIPVARVAYGFGGGGGSGKRPGQSPDVNGEGAGGGGGGPPSSPRLILRCHASRRYESRYVTRYQRLMSLTRRSQSSRSISPFA